MKDVVYKLIFNRKKIKLQPNETSLIQIEAYLNGKRRYFSTGQRVLKSQWSEKNMVVQRHENQIKINQQLRNKIAILQARELEVKEFGKKFTLKDFDGIALDEKRPDNFIEFIEATFNKIKHQYAEGTRLSYESFIRIFKEWGQMSAFADISYDNLLLFDRWVRSKVTSQATIYNYHKRLKVFIRAAISAGKLPYLANPYNKFQLRKGKSRPKYLTIEELTAIENKEIKVERLQKIRDVFVFCCYTGFGYKEAESLEPSNIITRNGQQWIEVQRQKTDTPENVPLLSKAREIIDRYRNYRPGKLLPVISNQTMNVYLKELATICEVDKKLTTHVARHTFATTVTLLNGVSIEVVSKMLGHTNIKTTQIYAEVINERVEEEMRQVQDKLSRKNTDLPPGSVKPV